VSQQFTPELVRKALGVGEVEYLGTGNFGETWRAQINHRDTACKIIYRSGYADRLEREIAGYRRVSSRNVVTLYEVNPITVDESSMVCLSFEYIAGGDLSKTLLARRPTEQELLGLATGLLAGVAAMHGAELLHRDLKPANIALRDGRFSEPVILDLGLARLLDLESITRYPAHVGSAMYMAPEQLRQERALRASDLWAVGVVLFEAATGNHPFFTEGETLSWEELFSRLSIRPDVSAIAPPEVARLNRTLSIRSTS
jgi:serine/threonine protein kinase